MSLRKALSALLLALGACSSSPSSSPGAPVPVARPASGALDLRDAPVTELVGQLAAAIGTPVTVDTAAIPLTRCARVTLVAPPGTPRGQLIVLATDVLRTSALSLTDARDHLALARIEGVAVPADCASTVGRALPPWQGAVPPAAPLDVPSAPIDGVRLIGENTYEVDPDAVIFADGPSGFMRAARVVPALVEGRVVGLRLFGIRGDSVFGALGFHNGDTVRRVNGRELSSPDEALESYAALRTAERIVVDLERGDALMQFTYIRRAVVRSAPGATSRAAASPAP
jgi:hypothetical protein